jgi:hypothetical protein
VLEVQRELPARLGPGLEYPVVAAVDESTWLAVTGISLDGTWYQVMLDDGSLAWIPASEMLVRVFGAVGGIPFAATPTATPTHTPSFTPSPTWTATPSKFAGVPPSPVPGELPDLSDAVLTLRDLPSGFIDEASGFAGFASQMEASGTPIGSFFAFSSDFPLIVVAGYTMPLTGSLDVGIDLLIQEPEVILTTIAFSLGSSGLSDSDVTDRRVLPGFTNLGDASNAATCLIDFSGVKLRLDVTVFRRDEVGAVLIMMYLDGTKPNVSLRQLAIQFDSRIEAVLHP